MGKDYVQTCFQVKNVMVCICPAGVPCWMVSRWVCSRVAFCRYGTLLHGRKCFQQHFLDYMSLHSVKRGWGLGREEGGGRRGWEVGTHISSAMPQKLRMKLWTKAGSWSMEHTKKQCAITNDMVGLESAPFSYTNNISVTYVIKAYSQYGMLWLWLTWI